MKKLPVFLLFILFLSFPSLTFGQVQVGSPSISPAPSNSPQQGSQNVSWSPGENVSSSGDRSLTPVVAYDSGGKLHVVWIELKSGSDSTIKYKTNSSGSWSPAYTIADEGGTGGPTLDMIIVGNTMHILYDSPDGIRHKAVTIGSGSPQIPASTLISKPGQVGHEPALGVDSKGAVHAAWLERRNSPEYQVIHRIWKNGAWEGSDRIVDNSKRFQAEPALVGTTDGKMHIVFKQGGGSEGEMEYAVFEGTGWQKGSPPPVIDKVNTISLTSDGTNVFLGWGVSQSQHNVYVSILKGGTWSQAFTINALWGDNPSITYSTKDNRAYVVWTDLKTIFSRSIDVNGSLSSITEIESTNDNRLPRAAAGPTSVSAVWQDRSAGSEEVKLSNSSVLSATISPVPGEEETPADTWVPDSEVTFVGKMAARANSFVNWTLENYAWSNVSGFQNNTNPLIAFWSIMRNIMYALFVLFFLVGAFTLVVTRGKNLTVKKFITRFLIMVVLVTFSFAILQIIYQIADIIQGFFLKNPDGSIITSKDLLYIGFDYKNFIGYKQTGLGNEESGYMTLLLTRMTAITYYVMTGVLLLRKVILWFFIVISPVFPLLLLFNPIRNTAKIWVGEFFRWLLYAPLFSILLAGLVSLWRIGLPLSFNFADVDKADKIIYPTAVNILLGGPGQAIGITNSVNLPDTFSLYVIALIMLWVATILPFLLLQIFLDHMVSFSLAGGSSIRQLISRTGRNIFPGAPPLAPVSPPSASGGGLARALPLSNKFSVKTDSAVTQSSSWSTSSSSLGNQSFTSSQPFHMDTQVLRLANLTVPTMRDIAKFEISSKTSSAPVASEVTRLHETLKHIGDPTSVTSPAERATFTNVRSKLVEHVTSEKNTTASTILTAATLAANPKLPVMQRNFAASSVLTRLANPVSIPAPIERNHFMEIRKRLDSESLAGNQLAQSVLYVSKVATDELKVNKLKAELVQAKDKGESLATLLLSLFASEEAKVTKEQTNSFPVINRVQSVSLDDYEAVKKMWLESYQKQELPETVVKEGKSRDAWVKEDIDEITKTINLLVSREQEKVAEGMQSVSLILPFLLMGGFSQTEIIAYLKAKLEAAKTVLDTMEKQTEQDDTLLDAKKKPEEEEKAMTAEAPTPVPEENPLFKDENTQQTDVKMTNS